MTKRQEDQLTMWTATNAVLKNYEEKWKSIAAFANAAHLFRKISLEVNAAISTQQQDNTGITQGKIAMRSNLTEQCRQMALNIESYAFNIKDFALEQQFHFTPTYFERLRDNALPVVAGAIFQKASDLKTQLSDYGVGDEELKELKTLIEKYKGMNPAPRLAKGEVKQATVNIADKINEGTEQLNLMDKLAGNFSKKSPEFVSSFRNARIVINRTSSKKLKKASDTTVVKQITAAIYR
ncbi:hypothetical protein F0919_03415 [Taibaiella lutea]|uniref:Uncharacterized protein n=1 Tax=Taibaiella lutea TaxID=2608001 RepID=A0A5M6CRY8_9BACT|nr:hypothetical protein [Taibaiella lutea]KAA5536732.1 hypothetical protein F0919_03415 [Taibaiella lutea]